METLQNIREAVQSELNVSSTSSLFSPTLIDKTIIRAYDKVQGLFKWPQLQDAKTTETQNGINYYDAPDNWRPQSIWRLAVNHVQYGEEPDGSPLSFPDFLTWKEENPNSTLKKWSMQWLRYFISPTPTASEIPICIWGQKNAPAITPGTDAAVTIFSQNMPECNEALALEASAMLKRKGEKEQSGQLVSQEANAIFIVAFTKFTKDTAKQEKIMPFLHVPDMFGRSNSKPNIGNFNVDIDL